ncbi:hypothetical protein TNCT6_68620 [Streptomyces sp. 6-11-2]|nr:hypothetical protein TNCT6_68620 [Streptomyces sp. 6-11-2]
MTAAGESPVRRPVSARVSGPWDSRVVKTREAAGVIGGVASGEGVERMAGNLGGFFFAVNEKSTPLLKHASYPLSAWKT